MKTILTLLASVILFAPHSAKAASGGTMLLCKKSSTGAISIRGGRCKSGESKINNVFQIDPILGFARINGTDGAVVSSGGNGTTGVSAVRNSPGDYTITFTGNYPATISATKLSVLATAQADNFQVTNAGIESASGSSIVIRIFSWKSDVTSEVDAGVFVQVLLGS